MKVLDYHNGYKAVENPFDDTKVILNLEPWGLEEVYRGVNDRDRWFSWASCKYVAVYCSNWLGA